MVLKACNLLHRVGSLLSDKSKASELEGCMGAGKIDAPKDKEVGCTLGSSKGFLLIV
jgi:hypothetical protein